MAFGTCSDIQGVYPEAHEDVICDPASYFPSLTQAAHLAPIFKSSYFPFLPPFASNLTCNANVTRTLMDTNLIALCLVLSNSIVICIVGQACKAAWLIFPRHSPNGQEFTTRTDVEWG